MSIPDPNPAPDTTPAPESEEVLLDINGNPIPRNWNPGNAPAAPDAEPPGAAKRPASARPGSAAPNRPSPGGARPPAYQPPPRPSPAGGFTPGSGASPGQEEVRYDLAGNPITVHKPPSAADPLPASRPASAPPKGKKMRNTLGKSGGASSAGPAGPLFMLFLTGLICYAGFVLYNKYQHNQAVLAPPSGSAPGASSVSSPSPSPSGGGKPAGPPHDSPFGKK